MSNDGLGNDGMAFPRTDFEGIKAARRRWNRNIEVAGDFVERESMPLLRESMNRGRLSIGRFEDPCLDLVRYHRKMAADLYETEIACQTLKDLIVERRRECKRLLRRH